MENVDKSKLAGAYAESLTVLEGIRSLDPDRLHVEVVNRHDHRTYNPALRVISEALKVFMPQAFKTATERINRNVAVAKQALAESEKEPDNKVVMLEHRE